MNLTEREKQLLRREGYIQCFHDANAAVGGPRGFIGSLDSILKVNPGIEAYAAEKYPLPVELRVENDPHEGRAIRWRVLSEGRPEIFEKRQLQYCMTQGGDWSFYPDLDVVRPVPPTLERAKLWEWLFRSPTLREDEVVPAPEGGR